jgi:hypothetical protein
MYSIRSVSRILLNLIQNHSQNWLIDLDAPHLFNHSHMVMFCKGLIDLICYLIFCLDVGKFWRDRILNFLFSQNDS